MTGVFGVRRRGLLQRALDRFGTHASLLSDCRDADLLARSRVNPLIPLDVLLVATVTRRFLVGRNRAMRRAHCPGRES